MHTSCTQCCVTPHQQRVSVRRPSFVSKFHSRPSDACTSEAPQSSRYLFVGERSVVVYFDPMHWKYFTTRFCEPTHFVVSQNNSSIDALPFYFNRSVSFHGAQLERRAGKTNGEDYFPHPSSSDELRPSKEAVPFVFPVSFLKQKKKHVPACLDPSPRSWHVSWIDEEGLSFRRLVVLKNVDGDASKRKRP